MMRQLYTRRAAARIRSDETQKGFGVTTRTAPISREALRLAREQRRLSQRELGRRIAARLGRAGATRAYQVRLSRIEKGDEITEEDRELVDALAAEFALGADDLGRPPRHVWVATSSGEFTFPGLGLRILAFSSPERAFAIKEALALATEGQAQPFREAQLVPISGEALLRKVLDLNYGVGLNDEQRAFLVPVDPDLDQLRFLWTLQRVLNDDGNDVDDLVGQSAEFALGNRGFEAELVELHTLALRRLENATGEAAHLLEGWKREEHAIFAILERIHELRRERRAEVLER